MADLSDYFGGSSNDGICLMDLSGVAVSAAKAQAAAFNTDVVSLDFLRHMILNSILANRKRFRREYPDLVIACDSDTNWRKNVYPFYKAHRKADKEKDSFDWDEFFRLFTIIKEEIRHVFPFKMLEVDGAEGDDIIGVLATHYPGRPILIHAKDSDFNQCCRNPKVKIWSPFKQKIVIDDQAEHNLFTKICTGETGDGIPNILSVNNSFVDKIRQKSMYKTKIEEWRRDGIPESVHVRFEENRELIDFRFIPPALQDSIVLAYETAKSTSDKQKIFAYLTQKELAKISATFLQDIEALT